MSPIQDPRFSKARWDKDRQAEREDSRRSAKTEYLKPLCVLAVAIPAGFMLTLHAARGGFAAATGGYFLWLALAVAAGTIGLLISAKLFLGETGPAGLSILRTAAAVSAAQVAFVLFGGGIVLNITAVLAGCAAYAGLAVWLFEMDLEEAALAGAITMVLVLGVSVGLLMLLAGG